MEMSKYEQEPKPFILLIYNKTKNDSNSMSNTVFPLNQTSPSLGQLHCYKLPVHKSIARVGDLYAQLSSRTIAPSAWCEPINATISVWLCLQYVRVPLTGIQPAGEPPPYRNESIFGTHTHTHTHRGHRIYAFACITNGPHRTRNRQRARIKTIMCA